MRVREAKMPGSETCQTTESNTEQHRSNTEARAPQCEHRQHALTASLGRMHALVSPQHLVPCEIKVTDKTLLNFTTTD
jgi:hypothetical protein